ncbi:MAG: 1,4-dihydroxy-2-naphthoate octaprenyltransferase [Syntrophobacterales bacterium]|jgi:1,4-dihydroxy-2-naphthoate octaprenyltransferase|nr:1,4-dihydroxy-2-naphthoate octaprenyltransferase [Syntrophobacterales bacterium]
MKLKAWIQASRPPFFITTLMPLVIGWVLAKDGDSHGFKFFLVIIAALMVHLATNLANDYFEHKEGTDEGEAIGGSRVIQEGKLSPQAILNAIIVLYFLAFVGAFYLMITYDLFVLSPMIIFASLSSLFYVAPPVRYGYRGLGEVFVGINMGPIMVLGTYWVMTGRADLRPLFVSIPVGLMVASILYYQSLPDMKTDRQAGKRTLAVRLGKKGSYRGLIFFFIAIYGSIAALTLAGFLSCLSGLCLLGVPVFLRMLAIVRSTDDWVLLDRYGKYIRILYFINSLAIVAGTA